MTSLKFRSEPSAPPITAPSLERGAMPCFFPLESSMDGAIIMVIYATKVSTHTMAIAIFAVEMTISIKNLLSTDRWTATVEL